MVARYARNNYDPANATPVWDASGGLPVSPGQSFLGYTQVTDLTAAHAVSSFSPPTDAKTALIQVNAGIVRYRQDGVAPTTTVGMLAYATGPLFAVTDFANTKFINNGSAASLNIEWYG